MAAHFADKVTACGKRQWSNSGQEKDIKTVTRDDVCLTFRSKKDNLEVVIEYFTHKDKNITVLWLTETVIKAEEENST